MSLVGILHAKFVLPRRVRVLAEILSRCLPDTARSIVDVGCGDGQIAQLLARKLPRIQISGLDVAVRGETFIPVRAFDGLHLPYEDHSVDVVMFVDVLHHTADPLVLLREAKRVARQAIIIKDHCQDGFLACSTLRFMDWVGNAHHGVALPYNSGARSDGEPSSPSLSCRSTAGHITCLCIPGPRRVFSSGGCTF